MQVIVERTAELQFPENVLKGWVLLFVIGTTCLKPSNTNVLIATYFTVTFTTHFISFIKTWFGFILLISCLVFTSPLFFCAVFFVIFSVLSVQQADFWVLFWKAVNVTLDCAPLLCLKWTVADQRYPSDATLLFEYTLALVCCNWWTRPQLLPLSLAHRRPLCASCPLKPDLRLFPYICFGFDLAGVTLTQHMLSTFLSHSWALTTSTSDLNPSRCTFLSGHSFRLFHARLVLLSLSLPLPQLYR